MLLLEIVDSCFNKVGDIGRYASQLLYDVISKISIDITCHRVKRNANEIQIATMAFHVNDCFAHHRSSAPEEILPGMVRSDAAANCEGFKSGRRMSPSPQRNISKSRVQKEEARLADQSRNRKEDGTRFFQRRACYRG